MSGDRPRENLGFDAHFAVEIYAMTPDVTGTTIAGRGDIIVEYDVMAKEYHIDGEIVAHHDESYPTYVEAAAAAKVWELKWGVYAEDIGG